MKNKTAMKFICICFIFLVLFNFTGNVFAAINQNYGNDNGADVVEPDLEGKLKSSFLLEGIAQLIYGLGSLTEKLVGDAFQLLTGTNMFPWADRVIFNTVPFLDVNFINPSNNSLFKNGNSEDTVLSEIIRNIYFTVLILAIGALGIIVGIIAIKLAISSIASEKAKYKEAISKFLIALGMLFFVHYGISFVFWINEKLVEIASDILIDNTKDIKLDDDFFEKNITDEQLVKNFFERQHEGVPDLKEKETKIAAFLLRNETYKKYRIPDAYGNNDPGLLGFFTNLFTPGAGIDSKKKLEEDIKIVSDDDAIKRLKKEIKVFSNKGIDGYKKDYKDVYDEYRNAYKKGSEDTVSDDKFDNELMPTMITKLYPIFINANKIGNGEKIETKTDTIISQMGQYFKENAWTYSTDDDGAINGWDSNVISLQGAILYTVFVVQSILFFIAYIKRFFYVVILALFAPAVVIYDFLIKAIN